MASLPAPSPPGYVRAKSSDSTTYEICVAKIAGTKELELKSSESNTYVIFIIK